MIAEKPQYPGRCMLCNEVFNKAPMTGYLKRTIALSATAEARFFPCVRPSQRSAATPAG